MLEGVLGDYSALREHLRASEKVRMDQAEIVEEYCPVLLLELCRCVKHCVDVFRHLKVTENFLIFCIVVA